MNLSQCVLCVIGVLVGYSVGAYASTVPEVAPIVPKTVVHVYGEEHFLKECSFDSATVKSVYPSLKAPIFQLLEQPLFLLVKTTDRANAVFLPQGLSTPETHPPVSPSIDTMLRSYEERHSLVFSLAHFPFKQFKELSLADFLTNGKSLKPGVPLTDIPVLAFYTKHELDELKPFFKFFYMGDLEVTSNSVSSNRKSSVETMLPPPPPMPIPMQAGYKSGEQVSLPNIQGQGGYKSEPVQGYKSLDSMQAPIMGYPYTNRLPSSHAQKHSFFLAPVPVIIPKQEPSPSHHDNLNHNILNRSPAQEPASTEKTAADLPVYSYKGVPLYIPRGRQTPSSTASPGPDGKSLFPEENSLPGGISSTESSLDLASPGERVISSSQGVSPPLPYSAPSGLGASPNEHVSLVFPSSPKPSAYSLPSGYGGIDQHVKM